MTRRILVIQHVPHEGLGTFAEPLTQAGCELVTLNAADPQAAWPLADAVQGVIVMGGPMAVYERHQYSFLTVELHFLRNALQQELPILGICLGAQLLAHALGGQVTRNPQQEIGWYPLAKTPEAAGDPLFAAFAATETVFQWHGDTFTLPRESVRLAGSPLCPQQAFRYHDNVYGLQFHVEVTEPIIQQWLGEPGNAAELQSLHGIIDPTTCRVSPSRTVPIAEGETVAVPAGTATGLRPTGRWWGDPVTIRAANAQHLPRLAALARHVATAWCRLIP